MGRKKSTIKNYIWSNVSTIISMVLNFINRTVLIKVLGTTFIGINSLFSNILGVLSFAELGIGLAISYCLYEPLSNNNIPKIKAIVNFYKNAYRIVGLIIVIIGLLLIPFLPRLAKGAEGVENLVLIFIIYIFNSASSYFFTYKSTVISADQKNYLISNLYLVFNILCSVVQITVLILFKNYILYVGVLALIGLIRNVYINYYVGKKYPYLKGRNEYKLDDDTKKLIIVNVKGLIYHQIGTVAINQTDSIIISSFINVDTVGLVSNYTTIISMIKTFVSSLFSALLPSYGNIIATESREYQFNVFNRISFIAYYLSCFTSVCLLFLSEPFIKIWLGNSYIIEHHILILLVINYYIIMTRQPLDVLSKAAGLFDKTKYSPILESIINLIASIWLVNYIGLFGVYVGTFLSSFVPLFYISVVGYKEVFKKNAANYLISYFTKFAIVSIYMVILHIFFSFINVENNYLNLLFRLAVCLIVPNTINYLVYRKTDEFRYFMTIIKKYGNKFKSILFKQ